MSKLTELIQSPHVHLSLVTGLSIITLAYFSKKVLAEPISYLGLAVPPFIATIYEAVFKKFEDTKIVTTWYWIIAIVAATFLVIFLS